MPALHLFNPGHETAVLLGTPFYTPPRNVVIMTQDLGCLPLWYANPGDLVYTRKTANTRFVQTIPFDTSLFPSEFCTDINKSTIYTACPWGISPHVLHQFQQIKKETIINLVIPEWKERYTTLIGSKTTVLCHLQIMELCSDVEIPAIPLLFHSGSEIEDYISKATLPVIVKAPYSSSGKGLLWLRKPFLSTSEKNWIKGTIQRQRFVSIEKGLEKTMDFAMEFYSDGKGQIQYEGLSVFNTEKGAYTGNKLASQIVLQKEIEEQAEKTLQPIRETVSQVLENVYGREYRGYLGVDMLLYQKNRKTHLHPCVEVNMRFTMGLVALRLTERFVHPEAEGKFYITYHKEKGEAEKEHQQLLSEYSPELRDGKIVKGYVSLCSVSEQTHYRAFILV
ncbi:MAG: hypothetical protein PHG27_13205 [Massilibacteroides sp.]|nr:hypothetical protein [Massilibacteroides sp.]